MMSTVVDLSGTMVSVDYSFDQYNQSPILFLSIHLLEDGESVGPDITRLLAEPALSALSESIMQEHSQCLH